MPNRQDIDDVLRAWSYKPGAISARLVRAGDGREVLQMRVELGVLQMELRGRPDGRRPGGARTYLDMIRRMAGRKGEDFELTEEQCLEIDREFLQYYHRRICCLALRLFDEAVADADHTLQLMNFVREHSPNDHWTASHERYRPFVLFHRAQASAMVALKSESAEAAIEVIDEGLMAVREAAATAEGENLGDQEELIGQLVEMKESLREEYHIGRTLAEQLTDAIATEQYERAARLRDEIARRRQGS
ncbi:MAG: UvrB/UvrC motif-containing protein [Planctomycetota bacterium]